LPAATLALGPVSITAIDRSGGASVDGNSDASKLNVWLVSAV